MKQSGSTISRPWNCRTILIFAVFTIGTQLLSGVEASEVATLKCAAADNTPRTIACVLHNVSGGEILVLKSAACVDPQPDESEEPEFARNIHYARFENVLQLSLISDKDILTRGSILHYSKSLSASDTTAMVRLASSESMDIEIELPLSIVPADAARPSARLTMIGFRTNEIRRAGMDFSSCLAVAESMLENQDRPQSIQLELREPVQPPPSRCLEIISSYGRQISSNFFSIPAQTSPKK